MPLTVDPDIHLIGVPAPIRPVTSVYASLPDLSGEHWAEPVPPVANRLVTDIDAAFEQNVFDLAQGQRVPHIHHNRKADDLGRAVIRPIRSFGNGFDHGTFTLPPCPIPRSVDWQSMLPEILSGGAIAGIFVSASVGVMSLGACATVYISKHPDCCNSFARSGQALRPSAIASRFRSQVRNDTRNDEGDKGGKPLARRSIGWPGLPGPGSGKPSAPPQDWVLPLPPVQPSAPPQDWVLPLPPVQPSAPPQDWVLPLPPVQPSAPPPAYHLCVSCLQPSSHSAGPEGAETQSRGSVAPITKQPYRNGPVRRGQARQKT